MPLSPEEQAFRDKGFYRLAGVDEVGRGPLAGPVVAAAVILPLECEQRIPEIGDSKKLSSTKRAALSEKIWRYGSIGIGVVSAQEIDRLNIRVASFFAMERALQALPVSPDSCLVDGCDTIPDLELPQRAVVKGDLYCYLIGAASIVAKVYRDALLVGYSEQYPQYGFEQHKGYPTKRHLEALRVYGPSSIHRRSFRGVCEGVMP